MHLLKRKHRPHIDKKLVNRLRIYLAISVILIGVVVFEIWTVRVSLFLALVGLVIGTSIGVLTARMFLLSWDKDAKRVISRLDVFGGIILALYVLSSVFRGKIIGQFVSANYVTGMSLSVVTGLMIGRVLGTGHKIGKILKEQNLF